MGVAPPSSISNSKTAGISIGPTPATLASRCPSLNRRCHGHDGSFRELFIIDRSANPKKNAKPKAAPARFTPQQVAKASAVPKSRPPHPNLKPKYPISRHRPEPFWENAVPTPPHHPSPWGNAAIDPASRITAPKPPDHRAYKPRQPSSQS